MESSARFICYIIEVSAIMLPDSDPDRASAWDLAWGSDRESASDLAWESDRESASGRAQACTWALSWRTAF